MNKVSDLIFSEKEGTSSKHKHEFRIKNSITFFVVRKAKVSRKIHREPNLTLKLSRSNEKFSLIAT